MWGIKYSIDKDIVINEKLFSPMLHCIENAALHIDEKVVEKLG